VEKKEGRKVEAFGSPPQKKKKPPNQKERMCGHTQFQKGGHWTREKKKKQELPDRALRRRTGIARRGETGEGKRFYLPDSEGNTAIGTGKKRKNKKKLFTVFEDGEGKSNKVLCKKGRERPFPQFHKKDKRNVPK